MIWLSSSCAAPSPLPWHFYLALENHQTQQKKINPEIIEIPESNPNFDIISAGWTYDGENWTPPAEV